MGYSFDGPNKRITLTSGTVSVDLKDLYSRWKDWVQTSDNSKYVEAFSVVGGDPISVSQGIYITSYYFLSNGWKIRPQEASHTLNVTNGVLVTDDESDPFIDTLGAYVVRILYSQPVRTETVATAGASVDFNDLLDLPGAVDGLTPRQSWTLMLAALANKLSGAGTSTVTIRDVADTKDRIVATVDSNGNRTTVTLDGD